MGTAAGKNKPEKVIILEKIEKEKYEETFLKPQFDPWMSEQQMQESCEALERQIRKSLEDFERRMRKSHENFDRWAREIDRQVEENNRQQEQLSRKLNSIVDHVLVFNISEAFNALDFNLTKYSSNVEIADKSKDIETDADLFLEGNDCAIAVKIEAGWDPIDIRGHAARMRTLRRYANAYHDTRKFYGAVAGTLIDDNVKKYALKNGFFVISQSGDAVKIDMPKGFKPREW